jgi:hypothetical protein
MCCSLFFLFIVHLTFLIILMASMCVANLCMHYSEEKERFLGEGNTEDEMADAGLLG